MKEEIYTEQSNYTNVWQSQKIITDVIQTWVTPTLTSLLTELVPFNISPLARRNPQLPRRNPVPSSSITSSKEILRKLCLVDAKNRCTSLEEQFKNLGTFQTQRFNSLNFSKNNLHKLSSTIKSKYCLTITSQQKLGHISSHCSSKTQYFSGFSALTTFKQFKPLLNMHTYIYPPSVFTIYAPSAKICVRSTSTTHSFMLALVLTYSILPANRISIPNLRHDRSPSTTLSPVKTQLQVLLEKLSSHLSIKIVF